MHQLHKDRLQAVLLATKIISICIISLYNLWIQRCCIIHTKLIDRVEIEEYVELSNKLLEIIDHTDRETFLPIMNQLTFNKVKSLPVNIIKGVLFEYYTSTHNETAYNRINERAKEYLNKINKEISKEEYIMREKRLELIDKFFKDSTS